MQSQPPSRPGKRRRLFFVQPQLPLDPFRLWSDEWCAGDDNDATPEKPDDPTDLRFRSSPTDLGNAMLIVENDDGNYAPICVVATIQARETAESDFRGRMRLTELGADGGVCPVRYKVWACGLGWAYRLAIEISA